MLALSSALVCAAETGRLSLKVLGDFSEGATNKAEVIAAGGKTVGEVAPGATVSLAPGEYKVVLPIIGGSVTHEGVKVEAGRTTTVLVSNVAALRVRVRNRDGSSPNFPVVVTDASSPHRKLTSMLTNESVLFAPNAVDVTVDAPPQGYSWHNIELKSGEHIELTLDQTAPAELIVQPMLSGVAIDKSTRVVIYKAGTQREVASSGPGAEHRFRLDPGDYDIYVENRSGKGAPYATERGLHLDAGTTAHREILLDKGTSGNGN
jgi:hypothetical protein